MAAAIEKVKHVLHLDKSSNTHTNDYSTTSSHTGTAEGVAGPHSSRVANAADPRVDSDLDGSRNAGAHTHTNAHTGVTGAGVGTHTNGAHTGLAGTNNHNHGATTTAGPHNSDLLNKADPRVDSDRSNQYGTTGNHHTHSGVGTGTTEVTGNYGTTGSTNAGPHNSNLLNKADPLVDSDRSHQYGTTGTGVGGIHNTHNTGSTNAGPHNSNLLNKADPRVDSDRSHQYGTTGTGVGGTHNTNNTFGNTGTHGGISNSTNAGPHNSNLLNKADPRVDSDLDGRGGVLGSGTHATPGSGTAQNTAGPHNSDTLNKLDPRVDADLDGSKTLGGNKTYA